MSFRVPGSPFALGFLFSSFLQDTARGAALLSLWKAFSRRTRSGLTPLRRAPSPPVATSSLVPVGRPEALAGVRPQEGVTSSERPSSSSVFPRRKSLFHRHVVSSSRDAPCDSGLIVCGVTFLFWPSCRGPNRYGPTSPFLASFECEFPPSVRASIQLLEPFLKVVWIDEDSAMPFV